MTTSNALIQIEGLHMRFDGNHVLRDLHLTVRRGETLAIVGESGCGKSVLLKTIIGLQRPTEGTIHINGENLADLGAAKLARLRLRFGFLFQQAALFDSLTVAENIAFPLRQHTRRTTDEIAAIVRGRLAQVGLPSTIQAKKPAELSGGMQKRVGLARALAMEPQMMLYDEPTTGLDPIMSDVINELILRTRVGNASEAGPVTSIVVTHDLQTVRKVADRVVMLYPLPRLAAGEPQIVFDGPPREIFASTNPRVAQFVRGEAGDRLSEV